MRVSFTVISGKNKRSVWQGTTRLVLLTNWTNQLGKNWKKILYSKTKCFQTR